MDFICQVPEQIHIRFSQIRYTAIAFQKKKGLQTVGTVKTRHTSKCSSSWEQNSVNEVMNKR